MSTKHVLNQGFVTSCDYCTKTLEPLYSMEDAWRQKASKGWGTKGVNDICDECLGKEGRESGRGGAT